jgi:hypothetical protein
MLANSILTRWDDIEKIRSHSPWERLPFPKFVDFHTSNACQMKCKGCAYGKRLDGKMMTERDHMYILEEFRLAGARAFDFAGGGDPLTLPYALRMFKRIRETGGSFGVITNGLGLTGEVRDYIAKEATYCRVSLETAIPLEYERYKGGPWFGTVVDNIAALVQRRFELAGRCEVGVKYAVGKSLRGGIHYREGVLLGQRLGVDNIQFKALRHEPEELTIEEKLEEDSQAAAWAISTITKFRPGVRWWIKPVPFSEVPQCYLNPLHTAVDHLGNVYLCCYYYYRERRHLIGNMLQERFHEFWGTEEHKVQLDSISRKRCAQVDCKFFRHHQTVEDIVQKGSAYFL